MATVNNISVYVIFYLFTLTTRAHVRRRASLHRKRSKEHVVGLLETINDIGNVLKEDTPELLILDNHNVMDGSLVNTVFNIEGLGKSNIFKCPLPQSKTTQAGKVSMLF